MIEKNLIKPKAKIGLTLFLDLISKWRNDLKIKKFNHVKLLQILLDECSPIPCMYVSAILTTLFCGMFIPAIRAI